MLMIGSSAILAASSAAFGFSLTSAGTNSDHGISESRQAGPPGLAASGISSSSHCTYLRGFRPLALTVPHDSVHDVLGDAPHELPQVHRPVLEPRHRRLLSHAFC